MGRSPRILVAILISVLVFALSACGQGPDEPDATSDTSASEDNATEGGSEQYELLSPAFANDGVIPDVYAREGAGGENRSIPLEWSGAPEGTRSYALILIDAHPVAHNWIHWTVVDIPADVNSLESGAGGSDMPTGSRELNNSWGELGYGGPQPPEGSGAHQYRATIYALDVEQLDIADDAELRDFLRAIEGHSLGDTTYAGFYGGQ